MGLNISTKHLNMNFHNIFNINDRKDNGDCVNLQTLNIKILREIEVNTILESQKYLLLDGEGQIVYALQMIGNRFWI